MNESPIWRQAQKPAFCSTVAVEDLFSYVCKGLLGNQVKASLILSGQGLQADVEVGGMAMESLKAVAFDLAAMLMSIEDIQCYPRSLYMTAQGRPTLEKQFTIVCFGLSALSSVWQTIHLFSTSSQQPAGRQTNSGFSPFLVAEFQGSIAEERLLCRDLGGGTN